jgi:hypothetical protein
LRLAASSIPLAQAVDETMTLSMAVAIPDLATSWPRVLINAIQLRPCDYESGSVSGFCGDWPVESAGVSRQS